MNLAFSAVLCAILCFLFPVASPLFFSLFRGVAVRESGMKHIYDFVSGPLLYGSTFMLAMAEYGLRDYETASEYFKKYYQTYPKGIYAENAKYYVGESLYKNAPEPRLDQSLTVSAIAAFQEYLDLYPDAKLKKQATNRLFALQDLLVEKEYKNAKLYYDLGTYFGNCTSGGNNYEACIVTAQNALKDYPYSNKREEFAILIMKGKYELAKMSVESKQLERYQDAEDECYGFINEYPDSKERATAEKFIAKCKEFEKAHPEDSYSKLENK